MSRHHQDIVVSPSSRTWYAHVYTNHVSCHCHLDHLMLATMVLKTRLRAKLDLPLIPGFGQFLAFFPNQTGGQFSIQLVGPVNTIRFLKSC